MYTPWGSAQTIRTFEPGVVNVTTAGHGGILCTREWAEQNLSAEARRYGDPYGGQLAYEEDCLWAIVMYENPHLWPQCFAHSGEKFRTEEQQRDYIWKTLSQWNPEYLLARGIEPEAAAYAIWQGWKNWEDRQNQRPQPLNAAERN